MALDKDHLFQGFATLKLAKNRLERGSQVLGLDRVEYLAHRSITRYPSNAVNALQIVLGAFFVKGEQRGRFEGEHGKGGHEGITQRDLGDRLFGAQEVDKRRLEPSATGHRHRDVFALWEPRGP